MSRTILFSWMVLAAIWIALITYYAFANWPVFSMDLSPVDSSTQEAYKAAEQTHVISYGVLSLAPPILAYGLLRLIFRNRTRA